MKMKIFFANFKILGPLGCQGWVIIPQNVKKVKITAPSHVVLKNKRGKSLRTLFLLSNSKLYIRISIDTCTALNRAQRPKASVADFGTDPDPDQRIRTSD